MARFSTIDEGWESCRAAIEESHPQAPMLSKYGEPYFYAGAAVVCELLLDETTIEAMMDKIVTLLREINETTRREAGRG